MFCIKIWGNVNFFFYNLVFGAGAGEKWLGFATLVRFSINKFI